MSEYKAGAVVAYLYAADNGIGIRKNGVAQQHRQAGMLVLGGDLQGFHGSIYMRKCMGQALQYRLAAVNAVADIGQITGTVAACILNAKGCFPIVTGATAGIFKGHGIKKAGTVPIVLCGCKGICFPHTDR